ncbi:MAG: cytochrome c oxidase subunit II [Alphaproteobacteria bacterium]|nr:cytochrome c oxidase subunit II [Alphaproteobacteria bacterium]
MRFRGLKHWVLTCAGMLGLAALIGAGAAFAVPVPGGIGFQPAATDLAKEVDSFHDEILIIITGITIFVTALLVWVMIRYNKRANPVPKKFSHNTLVEILWTALPVLILVFIAYRSFPLLYEEDVMPNVEDSQIVDIKVYGRQWFWSYIYGPGDDALSYDSNIIPADLIDPSKGQIRQLSVDNPMVAPAGKYVRLTISSSDVIHSWAMPQFRLKVDAVPGRINQLWFKTDKPGVYYGQCSELCGARHAYMPIELRILPDDQYEIWKQKSTTSLKDGRAYLDQVQPLGPAAQVASAK